MNYKELINELLSDPHKLMQKKPFTRGSDISFKSSLPDFVGLNETIEAALPSFRKETVTQEQFMQELDSASHAVLFDENIPSICIKTKDGGYQDSQSG